jgi:hypothetical protein
MTTSWDDTFKGISRTSDFGSDFMHPMEEDLVPDPRDVLVPKPPNGATRHPDYDLFGRDSGGRGPARAQRLPGHPRGYGTREHARKRDRERLEREAGLLQAEQAAEAQLNITDDDLTDDDFAGEPTAAGLPTWLFGLLGILGIWGVAELASHKGREFARGERYRRLSA